MRTPLGQILGYAEILEEDAADADQDAMLPDIARIKQAARDLLQLVDSVFRSDEVASVSRPSPRTRGDASAGAAAGTDSRDGAAVLEGARVLIVDDQQANRELLARQLSPHGLRIEVVEGARQALHRIESGDFDLVLLDLMMPEMNGVEMLEVLRRSHSAAELPVIMVTALDSREDVVAALRAGANDYVTTPAYSERLGQSLALVHLAPFAAQPGTAIRVSGPAVQCAAVVARIPFVDPERKRLRER